MFLYSQNSRYYKSDTENDLPQQNLTRNNYKYNSTMVQANETGRLDLVSYRVYGTPVHWWIIARFNSIIDPDSVQAGTRLRIPILDLQ